MVTFTADELLTIMRHVIPNLSPNTGKQISRKIVHLCDIMVDLNCFNKYKIVKNRSRSNYFAREFCIFFSLKLFRKSDNYIPVWNETRLLFFAQIFTAYRQL